MKFFFKPAPGLTAVVLIMLAVLLKLGHWQYQRLQWKTELIEEISQAAYSEPLTSLSEIRSAIDADEPIDFRRFQITATITKFDAPFRVYTMREADYGWRLFSPVEQDGIYAFGGFHTIGEAEPVPAFQKRSVVLAGYIRKARGETPRTRSTPDKNRWFGFNPKPETHNWSNIASGADTRFYLDILENAKDASALPAKVPNIRNRHFEYMLTWWSFAFILLIFYILMHKQQGRIGWS